MPPSYDEALVALYQSPRNAFVEERKRLSAQLEAGGDSAGAARLAKLRRPNVSAWAVNQLWWQERATFDDLFESAERLRAGDLEATAAHREASARLRARAAALLAAAGHPATEATLRIAQERVRLVAGDLVRATGVRGSSIRFAWHSSNLHSRKVALVGSCNPFQSYLGACHRERGFASRRRSDSSPLEPHLERSLAQWDTVELGHVRTPFSWLEHELVLCATGLGIAGLVPPLER